MGLLLERARKMFGGGPRELPPAEPFEIACACGLELSGVRQDQRQFVRCPRCGQTLFVLPLSPYPALPPLEEMRQRATPTEAKGKPRRRKRPLGVRLRIRALRARRRMVAGLLRLVPPARWFSPGRLLTYATLLLIAGTAALTIHFSRQAQLPSDIKAARAEWTAALEEAKFHEARVALQRAATALRRYGKGDQEQREIEQLAAEVALFDDLILGLGDSPQQLSDRLKDAPTARALVLDAFLSPTTRDDGTAGLGINARFLLGKEFARLEIEGLKLFKSWPAEPQQVLFGARIASVEQAPGAGQWVIRFAPDSGVLLTSELCLEKAGWPVDDATRTLLGSQKTWVQEQR